MPAPSPSAASNLSDDAACLEIENKGRTDAGQIRGRILALAGPLVGAAYYPALRWWGTFFNYFGIIILNPFWM